jgi:choline kinase
MEEYKVLITTSGIGTRLGDLTKYTNKALVRVGKKPAISYIVEHYPLDVELVITLGYFGNQIRDFLSLAYPNRKFKFIEVDKYDGEGSSLGYSLLKAKNELQCPFIFHASDTIIDKKDLIKKPLVNWLGVCYKENTSQYRTVSFNHNNMIYDKGDMNSNFVYIGLAGINDYQKFWSALEKEYISNPNNSSLSDCHAINKMFINKWETYEYNNWLDIGNASDLKHSRELISDKFELLDKVDESIFIFENFVIKFFYDKTICLNRVKRAKELEGLVPKIIGFTDNFYKYKLAKGELLSSIISEPVFHNFLKFSKEKLWIKYDNSDEFKKKCNDFYFTKTLKRLDMFYKEHKIVDNECLINNISIPSLLSMINSIDKDWLCSNQEYQFHGDYILDNIILNENNDFTLLDWRQDFAGDLKNGDIYYDLAKLNHNLLFNHDIVNKGLFSITKENNNNNMSIIKCDILRSDKLTNCREILHEWIKENELDLKKVKVLTAIIWLNMSPLHDYKMGEFLYYFGLFNLYKALNN